MRVKAIGPRTIEPIARVLQHLFTPLVLVPALVLAIAAHVWVYRVRGLTGAFLDMLYTPSSLLVMPLDSRGQRRRPEADEAVASIQAARAK